MVLSADEKLLEDGETATVSSELHDFLEAVEMEDLQYYGQKYTWSNHHTWCKLDRVLVNELWLGRYKESYARFDAFGISDHSPILVTINPARQQLKLPFRFKNIWVQDETFDTLV